MKPTFSEITSGAKKKPPIALRILISSYFTAMSLFSSPFISAQDTSKNQPIYSF
jgi:hypothetical protein